VTKVCDFSSPSKLTTYAHFPNSSERPKPQTEAERTIQCPTKNLCLPPPSGRAVSALNHLTHRGTSQTLFLKDEDPDEFLALLEDAFKCQSPQIRKILAS